MQSNIYQNQNNSYYLQRDMNFHDQCQKNLFQLIQVELNDGSVYQGILHSFDQDKMYLLMPQTDQSQMPMNMEGASNESRQFFFPFFGPFGLFGFPFFGIRRFGPFFPFFI